MEPIYPCLVDGLSVPFQLQNGTHLAQSDVHEDLCEALINLLVHADYEEINVSLMLRSPSGYFFRNPGSSRVLEADLLTGGRCLEGLYFAHH
ncbi:MAG: hypothetical protein M3014_07040 [Chloroflexota bacterium]|nr:hypothetical protein [Chloroflexota bacterium]